MAGSAETATQKFYETHNPLAEKYAESLGPIKLMGTLAAAGETTVEYVGQREVVFDDFVFAVAEMIATDPEFMHLLDVEPRKTYDIIDDKVRAPNGEPMVDMVARGLESSKNAAAQNPDMGFQVVRDESDELNAKRADRLPVGTTLLSPSMDPKQAFRDVPKTAEELGYEEGMMYWFRWSHDEEGTMDTQSYSVDMSDTELWRELISDFLGFDMPADVSANEWSRHGVEIQCGAEEADQLVRAMRAEYYRRCGVTEPRLSVTEYADRHMDTLRQIFDTYYPPLTEAANAGENNTVMSGLAAQILRTSVMDKLEPSSRRQLMHVANGQQFNDDSGRIMNSILRYVAVEELRKGLPQFIAGQQAGQKGNDTHPQSYLFQPAPALMPAIVPPEIMHERMAANFQAGVTEGRSYRGCAGQIGFLSDQMRYRNPQLPYGNAGNEENYEQHTTNENGRINCIKCGIPVNEKEAKKIEGHLRCPHCNYEIEACTGKEIHASKVDEKKPARRILELVAEAFPGEERHERPLRAEKAAA